MLKSSPTIGSSFSAKTLMGGAALIVPSKDWQRQTGRKRWEHYLRTTRRGFLPRSMLMQMSRCWPEVDRLNFEDSARASAMTRHRKVNARSYAPG
jgi:hypothetical protein